MPQAAATPANTVATRTIEVDSAGAQTLGMFELSVKKRGEVVLGIPFGGCYEPERLEPE